jgi:hypothetical protein
MKKIRITWNGKLLRDVYPHATRWQVFKYRAKRFIRKVMIVTASGIFLSGLSYTAFAIGIQYAHGKLRVEAMNAKTGSGQISSI